jgi:hypothetical protein
MKREKQTVEKLVAALMPVEASWLDSHGEMVLETLKNLPQKKQLIRSDVQSILDKDFDTGSTVVRLFLGLSQDEFTIALKEGLPGRPGQGVMRYRKDKEAYIEALEKIGILTAMRTFMNQPLHWADVLVERLRGGRGSAIKGQKRGRGVEDFVEEILWKVFDKKKVIRGCSFTGIDGKVTAKADFAVPDKTQPIIVIEVKAYGATGSKLTDVIGDVEKILKAKRSDTVFMLVTDGVTWKERLNDFRTLVEFQNRGEITKIYTKSMAEELERDLMTIKKIHDL